MKRCKLLTLLPILCFALASCNRDPRAKAQHNVDQGNKFFAKGRYAEAALMYRRALLQDMRFGEAYYRLGLTDLKLEAYGDAVQKLRRAVDLQPNNSDAATKLADLFVFASIQDSSHAGPLLTEAKDLADKLVQMNPNSYDGHRLKGQLALLDKRYQEAVQELEKANSIKPDQPELVLAYFQALLSNNQVGEAETVAKNLIAKEKTYSPMYNLLYMQYARQGKISEADQILKLKVQNNPKQARFLLDLALHYFLTNRRAEMDALMRRLQDEKEFPEGHLLAGDFYFLRLRELEHARDEYQAAIKAFPKDKLMYQKRLVELNAFDSKPDAANQILAEVLKEHPKDSDAIAMRAAMQLTSNNRDQINSAARDLQLLVTKSPQNHQYRFNLARALASKGEIEPARLQLEEAIKLRPDFLVAREMLAKIYLHNKEYAKALKASDDLLALQRNNLQGHLIRSAALLGVGDRDKARAELELITRAYPHNAEALFQVGYMAWQEKDFKRAERTFGELYKANPADPRGLVGVTETLASQGRLGDAIKETEKSLAAEPNRRDLKLFVANLYVRAERYGEAIKIYQDLLSQDPKSADLLYRLAETELQKGDLNTAAEMYRRCSQMAPASTMCLLKLGLVLDGTGKRDQAKPIYEQILKIQPDHAIALNNLSFIKAEEGTDLDQALTMSQRARQREPNSVEIADTLGLIYIKKSLAEEAVKIFQELTIKQPSNPTFHYHYGMALLQKGDRPSAKKELQAALKNKPSKDEAGKIQDLLQKN